MNKLYLYQRHSCYTGVYVCLLGRYPNIDTGVVPRVGSWRVFVLSYGRHHRSFGIYAQSTLLPVDNQTQCELSRFYVKLRGTPMNGSTYNNTLNFRAPCEKSVVQPGLAPPPLDCRDTPLALNAGRWSDWLAFRPTDCF